ncbi:uncharacterized protein LOC125940095 isoform X1 [Dermacentor silvarum]|uniref:uncharacterized protein LOC125940095 isoform X1 n=1 Tax=Dermacentor silvarum TaxID=543639 RepID=UPI0021012B40|nr:uncharacterized protein LOC125940095 isoform X1 [Dermacentor silvarum]
MELVKELGDPIELVLAEDHVVLKLDTAWPRDVPVPEGLSLADDNRLLLVANQRSLISTAKNGLPREARILKALFCGCVSFDSCDRYASAASELLRGTQEIYIVHNKDKVYKLVRMFPNVRVLALLHDCCEHELELDELTRDRSAALVEHSQLRQLVGSVGSLREGCLLISRETTLALLRTCPDVCRIDSPWVLNCFKGPRGLPTSMEGPSAKSFIHLWLGARGRTSSGVQKLVATAADVARAAKMFPFIEILQVVVDSLEALAKVSAFRNLRRLLLGFPPSAGFPDVDSALKQLLTVWPGLEELALENCSGVTLSTVAGLCPKIKVLKLYDCNGSLKESPLDADAFPNLECVEISMHLLKFVFYSFLSATRQTLHTACFADDGICLEFLQYCIQYGRRLPFTRLEHLTLVTELSLHALELEPKELHDVLKALPALRHLETDSYDLRMFFENYCVPHGRLSLSWIRCVYCHVHNVDWPGRCQQAVAASLRASSVPRT